MPLYVFFSFVTILLLRFQYANLFSDRNAPGLIRLCARVRDAIETVPAFLTVIIADQSIIQRISGTACDC